MPQLTSDGVTWSESGGNLTGRPNKIDDGTNSVTAAEARDHIDDTSNPHSVTAVQVPIADSGGNFIATEVEAALAEEADARQAHEGDTSNPHSVTAAQASAIPESDRDLFAQLAGATFTGTVDAPTLQQGGTDLASIFAALSGATFTGDVTATEFLVGGNEVADYGSNSNGEYVRFYNGVQVCWATQLLTADDADNYRVTWTFPAAFSTTPPHISHVPDFATSGLLTFERPEFGGTAVMVPTATQALLSIYRSYAAPGFSVSDTMDTYAVAVGTWF